MLINVKSSLLASTLQAPHIFESIQNEIVTSEEKLLFSFSFELTNNLINSSLSKLNDISKLLVSPVDDYISIKLTSSKSLKKHLEQKGNFFLDSIESGKISLKAEHWALFGNMISPETSYQNLLKQFALFEGKTVIKNPEFNEFEPLLDYLALIFKPLSALSKEVPLVKEVLNTIEKNFKQEFTFYLRYMNIGTKITILSDDLIFLINSL